MEAAGELQELSRIGFPPPGPRSAPIAVATFAFDSSQELLWAGNDYGRVTSFYGAELQRYTSYRGHGAQEEAVKQILPCDKGILSVGARSVHLAERRGRTIWHLVRDDFQDLRCLVFTAKGSSEVLVAGCQATMFRLDVEKGEIEEVMPAKDHYTLFRRGGQYICAATSKGSVHILDTKTFSVVKTFKAHQGWINDMDANSSFLVTCGWSQRQNYGSMLDPLARVFDLKTLMPLPPVTYHVGAAYVRMHPRMLTTGVIAGRSGQLQWVDIMNSGMVNVRQVNLLDSFLAGLEIAPSGEAIALADSTCCIHLWGSPSQLRFTNYSEPTEFADPEPLEKPSLDWTGARPLNSIGMPYYRDTLLSAWPSHMIFEVGSPPAKIDPAILSSLARTETVSYAPNPRKTRRNQATNTRTQDNAGANGFDGPKFLSEQAKDGDDSGRRLSETLDSLVPSAAEGSLKIDVPVMYRNVEIKYSKFGVDDFDFEYYNKTKFAGLETHISNSYANPLLQVMKFTTVIRNLALQHTATMCLYETCLLCELGFLFDMLEKADGQNCQATNLLKTFSSLSATSSLGLLEENSSTRALSIMIQNTNRYLLEKMASDYRQMAPQSQGMHAALATSAVVSMRCVQCANETIRPGTAYVHDLSYPPRPSSRHSMRNQGPIFSQVLKMSVERQEQTRGWCDRCKRYQQFGSQKRIQTIPPVLMINAAAHSLDAKQLWAKPGWLPQEIGIIVEQGHFFCYEGQDLQHHIQRGAYPIIVYELVGVVADINSGEHQKSHLVSMINVVPSLREKQTGDQWHLFNDFLVRAIPTEEALRFDPSWKLPSILTYQVKAARHGIDDSWRENLDTSLLYRAGSMRQNEDPARLRTLEYPAERPEPGDPVGIDAEFVALQQEELEIKADGSRATLRPSRLGLARVSVLRGGQKSKDEQHGTADAAPSLEFVPFIDDYIHTSEPIVDYLTAYSGISPGDLAPQTSPYAASGRLVSLKSAYKKLWLLLNLGCVFVGHGLPKDFRTINIHIPKAQVVDTVDLFFDKRRARKLSLRFLSWYLLGERVQVEGDGKGHDSVEDARMALKLWNKWKELEAQGKTERTIDEIYRRGREMGFKVPMAFSSPGKESVLPSGVATPSGRATPSIDDERSLPGTPAGKSAGLVGVRAVADG